ncbi:MAG TPA: SDR family NAD(P)-dependent oxidoreductase, partial [Bryobacteraceae bacterium]|nr:SDR family NAD(P)-dependent oxidoreductase [Bryobacteraceae bacterium]
MAIDLKGKTALVTGAGRGIGRAVALKLAQAGAQVMLNDLDRDVVFDTGMTIDKQGGVAKAMPGDITAPDFPEKLVNATVNGFGSID